MKRLYLLIVFVSLCCTRSEDKPTPVEEKTFINLYCDVISRIDLIPFDSRSSVIDSLFTHYSVTEESFKATIDYYNQDPERWHDVLENIVAELENRVKELEQDELIPASE